MKKFNWGIMGCSTIAPVFVEGLRSLSDANIVAVGSRDLNRAEVFSRNNKISKHYGSYEELVKDKEIDIIYISTTNDLHKDNILLALNNGKHVLCEKPLTMDYEQSKEVIDLARKKNLFLMEAIWTRFLPIFVKLRELLREKIIGDVKMIRADFGFTNSWGVERRLLNKSLGGGTLMDNGIYPISLPSMIFGKRPDRIESVAHIGKTGVDEYASYLFSYNGGEIAALSSAVRLSTPQDAVLVGTKGYIELPEFWHGTRLILNLNEKKPQIIDLPFESTGYNYEAREVMDCIRGRETESKIMSLKESLEIAKTMEKIRSLWK